VCGGGAGNRDSKRCGKENFLWKRRKKKNSSPERADCVGKKDHGIVLNRKEGSAGKTGRSWVRPGGAGGEKGQQALTSE